MEASNAEQATGETSVSRPRLDVAVWGIPTIVTLLAMPLLTLLFYDTFRSIVSTWWRSDTFAHGFLILPISLYLIWDERDRLVGVTPLPEYRALPLFAVAGFGWLLCRLAGVLVLEQYFAVVTIPIAVWVVLGNAVARRLAFPLGFLLLGVPIGEFLIPPLIDFTAAFTVAGLRLTGVSVLQDGNLLTLAGGQWSVVEACSGLRYLIACVTLGLLYAHLTYRSRWRQGICVLASVIVPIIANGFRAYMIVMIGHLSDMKLAVGVDHLIYGWVFFGIVIFVFFWAGSFFREDNLPSSHTDVVERSSSTLPARRFIVAGLAAIGIAAVWPAWASQADNVTVMLSSPAGSLLPNAAGDWSASSALPTPWRPHYVGPDVALARFYERDDVWVGVDVACYAAQRQGAELVNASNTLMAPDESSWRLLSTDGHSVSVNGEVREVMASVVDLRASRLLVWKWYWIDGASTVSPYYAKFLEMTGKLAGEPPLACGMTAFTTQGDGASPRLTNFLGAALPDIEARLAALPQAK